MSSVYLLNVCDIGKRVDADVIIFGKIGSKRRLTSKEIDGVVKDRFTLVFSVLGHLKNQCFRLFCTLS